MNNRISNIKFRGWDNKRAEWVHGYYCAFGEQTFVIEPGKPGIPEQRLEVDPDSVGQYTGLDDKNGKEIYEGDVLLHTTKKKVKHYWQVFFERGQWLMRRGDAQQALYDKTDSHELAGNIREHPELIQQ